MRNHGFILTPQGWRLSPAFDINPSIDKDRLALNINMDNNILNLELAQNMGIYFRLSEKEMKTIIDEVRSSVTTWKKIAQK